MNQDAYRALREHAAFIDLTGRGHVRVTGEDRARLLHAMTTNQVEALKPGESCYAFFLTAQGRILADVNVLCTESSLLLDTEPEVADAVYQHLDRYIIADDVTLENLTEQVAVIGVEGPEARGFAGISMSDTPSTRIQNFSADSIQRSRPIPSSLLTIWLRTLVLTI